MLPKIDAPVYRTANGTPYLREPGVVMLSRPHVDISGMQTFLDGFDADLNFGQYLNDPTPLPPGEQLVKVAGQLCYMSLGPQRTYNCDCARYLENIRKERHGSVTEHANFTFLFYGVSRSLTHELVRHRAGCAYSQQSQRYVGRRRLRFVQRAEYIGDQFLHELFERRIDRTYNEHQQITDYLTKIQTQGGRKILSADAKTDLLKKVRQASRSLLPNETEAPLIMTANARAWRHIIEMRADPHAETEIRELLMRVYKCLVQEAPILFTDYVPVTLSDGTEAVTNETRKV